MPVPVEGVAEAELVEVELQAVAGGGLGHALLHRARLLDRRAVLAGQVLGAALGRSVGAVGSSSKLRHVTVTWSRCGNCSRAASKPALADVAPGTGDVGPDLDVHAGLPPGRCFGNHFSSPTIARIALDLDTPQGPPGSTSTRPTARAARSSSATAPAASVTAPDLVAVTDGGDEQRRDRRARRAALPRRGPQVRAARPRLDEAWLSVSSSCAPGRSRACRSSPAAGRRRPRRVPHRDRDRRRRRALPRLPAPPAAAQPRRRAQDPSARARGRRASRC